MHSASRALCTRVRCEQLHGLTYSEVYSYFGTENPNARSDGPYTNTSKTLECMSEYLLATRCGAIRIHRVWGRRLGHAAMLNV